MPTRYILLERHRKIVPAWHVSDLTWGQLGSAMQPLYERHVFFWIGLDFERKLQEMLRWNLSDRTWRQRLLPLQQREILHFDGRCCKGQVSRLWSRQIPIWPRLFGMRVLRCRQVRHWPWDADLLHLQGRDLQVVPQVDSQMQNLSWRNIPAG